MHQNRRLGAPRRGAQYCGSMVCMHLGRKISSFSNFEIKKAQHLRYQIFFKNKKDINKPINNLLKRDFDFYDKISDHIIIIDNNINNNENVVGTYRLL